MTSTTMTVTIQNPSPSLRDLRDIREDLRSRIDAMEGLVKQEQTDFQAKQEKALADHKRRMDAFQKAITSYRNMLSLEETLADARLVGSQDKIGPMPEVKIQMPTARLPLPEFFIAQITENGPMSKEELRQAAQQAGYFAEGDSGGRATHATLANITRSNRVIHTEDGKFSVVKTNKESVFS